MGKWFGHFLFLRKKTVEIFKIKFSSQNNDGIFHILIRLRFQGYCCCTSVIAIFAWKVTHNSSFNKELAHIKLNANVISWILNQTYNYIITWNLEGLTGIRPSARSSVLSEEGRPCKVSNNLSKNYFSPIKCIVLGQILMQWRGCWTIYNQFKSWILMIL